jgi:hypothetical protein
MHGLEALDRDILLIPEPEALDRDVLLISEPEPHDVQHVSVAKPSEGRRDRPRTLNAIMS